MVIDCLHIVINGHRKASENIPPTCYWPSQQNQIPQLPTDQTIRLSGPGPAQNRRAVDKINNANSTALDMDWRGLEMNKWKGRQFLEVFPCDSDRQRKIRRKRKKKWRRCYPTTAGGTTPAGQLAVINIAAVALWRCTGDTLSSSHMTWWQ